MKVPAITGIIQRRILLNFCADPHYVQSLLPENFSVKTYRGNAIVGICLIRLSDIRPKHIPLPFGISSENGAHRIAVEWMDNGIKKSGVYIPRRDSSSRINNLVGGRLFPGIHHLAKFTVQESQGNYHVSFTSSDDTFVSVDVRKAEYLNSSSVFENIENASSFFECGAIGYSPAVKGFDGIELKTKQWLVEPLEVLSYRSSFFENKSIFPEGSIKLDNALLMTNTAHEWHSVKKMNASLQAGL